MESNHRQHRRRSSRFPPFLFILVTIGCKLIDGIHHGRLAIYLIYTNIRLLFIPQDPLQRNDNFQFIRFPQKGNRREFSTCLTPSIPIDSANPDNSQSLVLLFLFSLICALSTQMDILKSIQRETPFISAMKIERRTEYLKSPASVFTISHHLSTRVVFLLHRVDRGFKTR